MQHRMKTHPLTEEKVEDLLSKVQTGSLATLNPDGVPYVLPVHFVYTDQKIFIHGLPKGQKIDNIMQNSKVSFLIYEMQGFLYDPEGKPCDTNTEYESVVVTGEACLLKDVNEKRVVLKEIVKKYTPHLSNALLPENMVKGTAIIQIDILEITGKYYK